MASRKGNHDAKAKPADKAPEKEEAGKLRESSGSAGVVQEPPAEPVASRSPGGDGGGDAGKPVQHAPANEVAKPGEPRQSSGSAGVVQEPPVLAQDLGSGRSDAELGGLRSVEVERAKVAAPKNDDTFPRLLAMATDWSNRSPDVQPNAIRITSKREGFRRCGVAHSTKPTEHPIERFRPGELEQLLAEPNLVVELI